MKIHTKLTIVVIALGLGIPLHAAETRKQNRANKNPAQQVERSFDALAKAVDHARREAVDAISQRDSAIKALEAVKLESQKDRAKAEARHGADMKAHKKLEEILAAGKREAARSAKELEALRNQAKASEAAEASAAGELADARRKLEKANQALAIQIKTISDAEKEAKAADAKHAEMVKNLKARDAELEKLRNGSRAAKGKGKGKEGD